MPLLSLIEMKRYYKKCNLPFLIAIVCLCICTACQSDGIYPKRMPSDATVGFTAKLSQDTEVKTRALDTLYVTSSPFNGNFYIELYQNDVPAGSSNSIIATYKVPSGFEGILEPINEENQLQWQNLDGQHSFYSWTLPFFDGYSAENSIDDGNNFDSSLWTDAEEVSTDPITIYFHDSPEGPEYNQNKNNSIYETFIGAASGPYSYIGHGKYVDFTFRHLVSKINVDMLALIKEDNSVNKDALGDITFIGMPSEAIFYPHPTNGEAPYVTPPDPINPDSGVTFFINNQPGNNANGTKNEFYICPELDFSTISFKINLNNAEYGNNGDYFGSFYDVEFIREGDEDFNTGDGSDSKILHAGEMMTLNFQLIPGVGPGVSVIIQDWNTESQRSAVNHPYQGIYTSEELQELIDLFKKFNPTNNPTIPDDLMEYFDLYGVTMEDGQLVFPLYDNVQLTTSVVSIFKSFIIDGQGHQLVMDTNRNNTFGGTPYYNIGPVKDIYICDGNGNNSIYIDSEGYVYIFDETTQDYKKTENRLTDLGTQYNSYDINPVTGEVILSNYYS